MAEKKYPLSTRALLPLFLIILILPVISCGRTDRPRPVAVKGVLDLSGWDLEKDGPVDLNGEWEFYWKKLVAPEELQSKNPPQPDGFIKVPGSWNNFKVDGKEIGEDGYATYRLTVIAGLQKERLGLTASRITFAYRLYIDGALLSSVGKVGTTATDEFVTIKSQVVAFPPSHNRIDILFHVSNHLMRRGGFKGTIRFGRESDVTSAREMRLLFEYISMGILIIMSLYHFSIYFLRKNDRIPLYFGLVCFFLIHRFLTTGEMYIYNLTPGSSIKIHTTIMFIITIFIVIFFIMYFYYMFKNEVSKVMIHVLLLIIILILMATIITPIKIQYILNNIILAIPVFIIMIYMVFVLVRMVIRGREGSILFLSGIIVILIFTFIDMLWANNIIQTELRYNHGMLIFVLIQAFAIAKRYSNAFDENLTLKNGLEVKVEERTAELAESNKKLSSIGDSLKRYLPMQLVDSIIRGEKITGSHTERRKLTIFFSDIKAFTDTTDSLEAEELSNLLNEYLTEMTAIAMKHGGTIDKFVGDAIMIFFGAPESHGEKEDALRCLRMAVAMQARMQELQKKWFDQGIENPLQIRIGVNTGVATVGDFGAEERLSYTAIGGQVNLASRLESLCEPGKILISHATWALVKEEFPCTPKGKVQVKGIHHDVLVYEVGKG